MLSHHARMRTARSSHSLKGHRGSMKVAILGTIPYHKMLAPFDEPEWDIWVCSPGNSGGVIPRVTRWYELHGVVDLKGTENREWCPGYFNWLKSQAFPVYMQEPNDLLPQAKVFPIKDWLTRFEMLGRIAATSSISLMIGHAIMEGATEIGVFGVNMEADEEQYGNQKSGCLIMLAIARGLGIATNVPLESCLGQMPPVYGYAEATRMGRKLLLREMELTAQVNHAQSEMNRWERELYTLKGALTTTRYMRRTFVDGAGDAILDSPEEVVIERKDHELIAASANGTAAATVFPSFSQPVIVPDFTQISPEKIEVETLNSGVVVPKGTVSLGGKQTKANGNKDAEAKA